MRKIFILTFLTGILIACDPGTGDLFYVDNKSDFDIIVTYRIWELDSIIIAESGQNTLIYEDYYLGTAYDEGDNFLMSFDTIFFSINDSMNINKDCLNRESWDFKISGGDDGWGDGGLANYTLVVENDDIARKAK